AVFHHDGLAEIGCNAIEYRARNDVGGAAGAEWNESLDRLGRAALRRSSRDGPRNQSGKGDWSGKTHAARPPCPFLNSRVTPGRDDCGSACVPYAAFVPCRLCEASLTVKNTTSASGVASAEWITLDGTYTTDPGLATISLSQILARKVPSRM